MLNVAERQKIISVQRFKSRTLKALNRLNIAERQKIISVHLRASHQRYQRSKVYKQYLSAFICESQRHQRAKVLARNMKHWYVLHTKPHQEQIVAAFLRQRQVESYLPLVHVKPANPRASRTRPYFPCYLFVQADLDLVGVEQLYWTPGLRRLVEFGGQPAEVPNHFMFDLRQRVNQICSMGELIVSGVKKGDVVKIVEGPFAGYEALFDLCLPGTERVRVLLTLLEKQHSGYRRAAHGQPRAVPLELNANSIVKAKPKSL